MILDSNFLIHIKEGKQGALEQAAEIEAKGDPARVPTPVIFELYVSVWAGDDHHENARKYGQLIENKPVVPLDENISRRAGTLEGQHYRSDTKPELGAVDAMVAATGLVFNEPVVTDDRGFQSVDGLEVVTY